MVVDVVEQLTVETAFFSWLLALWGERVVRKY